MLLIGLSERPAEPNYKIRDEYGNVLWRVDFAWPELGVFLEFDGKVKYTKFLKKDESVVDAVLAEKKREAQICGLTGWRCIRLTWADLARPISDEEVHRLGAGRRTDPPLRLTGRAQTLQWRGDVSPLR